MDAVARGPAGDACAAYDCMAGSMQRQISVAGNADSW